MLRPRIIPCLLVHKRGLVKTVQFQNPKYVGDPLNAVKIFNEKEADELVVLDIDATRDGREPDYRMIANLAFECRMPLCYGGGINSAVQAKKIISLGVEKIAISSAVIDNRELISTIADTIGRQSVVVVIDVCKKAGFFSKGYEIGSHNALKKHKIDPIEFALKVQSEGAGEIVINSIDYDGQMKGFDFSLAAEMRSALKIPMTVLGGCGSLADIQQLISKCGVVGAGVGSFFVFKGPYKAVLINYPNPELKDTVCKAGLADFAEI